MASREVTVVFLGDAAQYEATLERMGVATDAAGDAIADKFGAAGASASGKFGDALDEGTSKIGNLFKKLGEQASQFGLPFSSNLTKIGNDLNDVETKGKGVVSAMTALGAVGIAALAGVAAESVHLADGFDKAQAALKTAVTNSGTTWSKYSSQIGAATKTSGALVTGNAQEVEEALTTITTATNNPKEALKDLALVENMAALKHESLADASNQLSKILGGNTRVIQQWGINLDIGSTKLNAIQKAEEALQSAQLNQKTVQAEVNDGQLQGVAASSAQEKAALSVRNATLNLTEDQNSLKDVMEALNQRTKNAATNLGGTLAGQMTIAKNTVHDLGIQFGEFLVPYIDKVLSAGAKLISWIVSCKPVAIALATAIGGPLAASMTLAAGRAMLGMVSSLGKLAIGFTQAGASALSHIPVIGTVFQTSSDEAVAATMKQISALDIMTEDQVASLATQENQWKQYAVVTTASANVVLAETGEIDAVLKGVAQVATEQAAVFGNALHSMGVSAQQSAAIVAGADTEMVASADAASTGIKVALGSTGVGLVMVGLGVAATEMMTHWNSCMTAMTDAANHASDAIADALNAIVRVYNDTLGKIAGQSNSVFTGGGQGLPASARTIVYGAGNKQQYVAPSGTTESQYNAIIAMANKIQPNDAKQTANTIAQAIMDVLHPKGKGSTQTAAQEAGFSSNAAYIKSQITAIQAELKSGKITKAQASKQETAVENQNPVGPSSIQNQNNVAQQVSSFMSSQGFNMTAIAGMLGNAQQESSMNPNTPGGGLFQQVSNFGQGTGGSLENQLQTMLPQIESLKTSMNAAGTPAQAAAIFEQAFEKAGIPAMANRENYATQAYTTLNGGTPGSTLTPLGATPTPTGGAGTTTITAGEAAMEVIAKKLQEVFTLATSAGTSFSQQGKTVQTLASLTQGKTGAANSAQFTALENSLNATQNPVLTTLASSIESTWQNATTKLTDIIDSDTTKGQSELQKLQSAQNATSLSSIQDATTSAQKASLNDLVNELVSTHQKALETLAKQLELNWSSAMASLKSIKGDISQALKADKIANAASIVAINTQAAGSTGQSAAQISGLKSQQTSDRLSAAATAIQDAAKIQTDQAQAQTTAITDAMNISSASAQAQAQQIADAAKLMSDAAQIEVNSINAQTTAAHDTTSAMVQAIQNQTQTQVDTLGERGLYGLQLVAQQAKVVLDQQVATDDANIAAAQAHLDQVTAQTNQNVALAQQKADTDQAAENATVAAAQMNALITQQANDAAVATATANADLVQQTQDAAVASAQAKSDAVQIQSAIQMAAANQNNFNAQLQAQALQAQAAVAQSNSQFVTGSAMEADEYQSQLLQAQATQITNNGAQLLQAVTNQTNANNQNASNALQQAQSTATQAEARAQAQLSAAQSAASVSNATATAAATAAQNAAAIQAAQDAMALSTAQNTASIQQSLAQQQLSAIQSQASLTEAKLTSIVNIDQELANVEYAGSGINIYVTGLPADNAAAIGAATSYALRYQVS